MYSRYQAAVGVLIDIGSNFAGIEALALPIGPAAVLVSFLA